METILTIVAITAGIVVVVLLAKRQRKRPKRTEAALRIGGLIFPFLLLFKNNSYI